MNIWKFGVLVLALAVNLCNAIECYICDSSTNPMCETLKDKSIKPEECTYEKLNQKGDSKTSWLMAVSQLDYFYYKSAPVIPMVCQKIVGTDENKQETTVRRCQLNHVEQCEFAKNKVVSQRSNTINHCSVCDKDRCNAAAALHGGLRLVATRMAIVWAAIAVAMALMS